MNEAQTTYNILKPYIDDMWVEGLEITPLSLEAYYHHKGSKLEYSHAVLEAVIGLWNAYRKLEVACRNQW